ncbi:hypothetical protein BJAS_P1535 [Bathymodiolus japonicus methanotrophic gill symbiont]|uniref:hypothetical protein n=1 Tax=Bathymodiolus japonicus methanotrophic gill symbiont TaxID=113269 RepID=UPI001B7C0381|nr:hypothetical protein [Bathymodiolus japonicus methanotrophic gill symbiont]GFO71809.1 hypothetical protein BJAS_P1535 [Bathymodiolus japonicus methanotrophic gill symbiont]
MKNIILTVALGVSILLVASCGEESTTENIQVKSNKVQRTATETVHRIEEAVCTGTEAECLAKKAKNRAQETAEFIKDKAEELNN